MRIHPIAALALFPLAACNDAPAPTPQATASESAMATAAEPSPVDTPAPSASPSPMASPSQMPSATTIPAAVQGRWGLVANDCDAGRADAKGLLTIGPDSLKFYESRGKLGKIAEIDGSRIRASFEFSGEGMTWSRDEVLDAQDGGKTLIRREYGEDAAPGPLRYSRCP